jgi:hypothetical protein
MGKQGKTTVDRGMADKNDAKKMEFSLLFSFIVGVFYHYSDYLCARHANFCKIRARSQESVIRFQVSAVNGKSLSRNEYPVSSIELLNPYSAIRNPQF